MEQYQQRNLELDRQPVGASEEALGIMAVVALTLIIEGNSITFNVPVMHYSLVSHSRM